MRILGIDPGIGHTGFAIIDQERTCTLAQSGEIRPSSAANKRLGTPLKILFMEMETLIHIYQPTVVAIEDTFFAKNVKSALTLGQAKGVARLAAEMKDLPVFEYTPRAVKMAVVGYGGATKEQVQEMVFRILALPGRLDSEHASDAAAVAICHAHSAKLLAQMSPRP
jgi:crossover junction endodeoxyribonuclease RuvC